MTEKNQTSPMTVRLNEEEHEFLRLLAVWWCSQTKIPRPDKVSALRKMLRMVQPPTDKTSLGQELRDAHAAMMGS